MKKATFVAIKTALTNFGFADEDILAELDKEINKGAEAKAKNAEAYELDKEINKGAEAKAKNAEAYESFHELLINALSDAPATCGEIFESIEDELPEGITKGKVQYALTHLWQDEIVKIEGKPNTYRRA